MPDDKQSDPSSEPPASASSPKSEGAPVEPEAPAAPPPAPAAKPAAAKPAAAKPAAPAGEKKPPAAAKPAARKPAEMATQPWSDELTAGLRERFGDQIRGSFTYVGQKFLLAAPEAAIPILEYLKFEADFDYLVDITAVDYPKREERFDVVYIVYSFARNERLRLKVRVRDGEQLESAVSVHLTADWLEREVYDMFGIEFRNHPGLKRILMPDDWEGFPLRKDYDILHMDQQWVRENLEIESGQ